MKKILSYSPEVILGLAMLHTAAAAWLVWPGGPEFTGGVRALLILAVLGALSCWTLAVMLYTARPWLPGGPGGRAGPGTREGTAWIAWAAIVMFTLPGLALIPVASVLLAMSVHPTAYEPRVMVLILTWGFCLGLAITLVVVRSHPGPSRRLAGPLRAWHLALVLLAAIGYAAWPLAEWNPTLRHTALDLKLTFTSEPGGLAAGDPCRLLVGWFPGEEGARCKVDLYCGERRLYGGYKRGVFDCAVHDRGFEIDGHDADSHDGDPALRIDTAKGILRLATSGRLPGDATLEASFVQAAPR